MPIAPWSHFENLPHILQGSILALYSHYGIVHRQTYAAIKTYLPRIPPNCRFEVDNYEQLWPYKEPFDYIHGRDLEGAIGDHEQLFCQAIDHLKPGGWFEMAAIEVNILSDDETHLKAESLLYTIRNIHKSSRMFGKYANSVSSWSSWMTRAGFVNVKEKVYKVSRHLCVIRRN